MAVNKVKVVIWHYAREGGLATPSPVSNLSLSWDDQWQVARLSALLGACGRGFFYCGFHNFQHLLAPLVWVDLTMRAGRVELLTFRIAFLAHNHCKIIWR